MMNLTTAIPEAEPTTEMVTAPRITTTLAKIKSFNPCPDGWRKLLRHLGKTEADDAPIDFPTIARSNGVPDAIWCLRTVWDDNRQTCVNFVADVAEHVLVHWETWAKEYAPQHLETPRRAIEAARVGDKTASAAAAYAASAAAAYAYAAYARAAASAAYAYAAAARAAASAAASAAYYAAAAASAAYYAAAAASAAYYAASAASAASDAAAARAAEREFQIGLLVRHFGEILA